MRNNAKMIIWILILVLVVGIYNQNKPLPTGTSLDGEVFYVSKDSVDFLYDLTYQSNTGQIVYEQEIFNRVFEVIDDAEKFITIDMFLIGTNNDINYRNLTQELTDHLIENKKSNPEIVINFITDEYNIIYGSYKHPYLEDLKNNGVNVIYSNMDRMRDNNGLYSSFWRVFFYVLGIPNECRFSLMNFGGKNVCIRSGLKLLNLRANHRKLIIADKGEKIVSVIMSANPHDASSAHSNVGFYIEEKIWQDIYNSEKAIADFSGRLEGYVPKGVYESDSNDIGVQFLTEGKIKKSLVEEINNAVEGEEIDVAMFYLSDIEVVESLIDASERGVDVRFILDANKDAFGMKKNGVPNKPVADILMRAGKNIQIRWYDTHGEQFHTKLIVIKKKNGKTIVFLGSANLTRRNIGDYNLEADVKVIGLSDLMVMKELHEYYNRLWFNKNGTYTADYEKYEDGCFYKKVQYFVQEKYGLGTF